MGESGMTGSELIINKEIQSRIYTIRGIQVMLDVDLAELYDVEVRRLNEQVKRNVERFPESFRFQLTDSDMEILKSQVMTSSDGKNLKSQFATSSWGGRRTKPYVFTEQGVAMRRFITTNTQILRRLMGTIRRIKTEIL